MRRTHRPRFRQHSRTALTLACLAAGVSGSALRMPQAPQSPVMASAAAPLMPVAQPAAAAAPEPMQVAQPEPVAVPRQVVAAAQPEPAPVAGAAVAQQTPPAADAAKTVQVTQGRDDQQKLRAQLRWLPVRVAGRELATLDAESRLLLVRSAAERAGLAAVGLDYRDVYGVINAETTWVARTGMGRNGVASHGLAQFEPATARALGVRDANDPVEAVHAAATLLKEAAQWSARRIAGLGLSGGEQAARLREGVSIYYNLSSRARERWDGLGHASLPIETQRHIANVRIGALQAERLQRSSGGADAKTLLAEAVAAVRAAPAEVQAAVEPPVRRVAAVRAKPAAPKPLGYIAWSGSDADAGSRRSGKHVVWSNGTVTQEAVGRVRWTSASRG